MSKLLLGRLLLLQGKPLNWNRVLSMVVEVRMQQHNYVQSVFSFIFSVSFPDPLGWWNACGFLTSVAKQNSSNSLKFGLLVACLCGSFSLSFGSKTLGGISVSDLNQNIFLIGTLITETEKYGIKTKGNTIIWTIQFVHFPSTLFSWCNNKITPQLEPQEIF